MFQFPNPDRITPEDFELTVKRWFESCAGSLDGFEAQHRESVAGVDGEYEIDITLRFTAFGGAAFVVICECKKHKNAIKREMVQVLRDRKESLGAHKACLVATARFQDGAVKYAAQHGIALIQVVNGAMAYVVNSAPHRPFTIPDDADPYVGLFHGDPTSGLIYPTLVDTSHTYDIEQFLLDDNAPSDVRASPP